MKLKLASRRGNGPRRPGRKSSLWSRLTGRSGRQHRLPAHVTGEGDWEVEVPQIRMSRAFAVMLVLHIVAVGGLFAFRIWGRDDEDKLGGIPAEDPAAAAALIERPSTPEVTAAPAVAAPLPAIPADPQKKYILHSGDTIQLVAARFGVSVSALREANPDKPLVPGAELIIPRNGRIIGGLETADASVGRPAEIFDPLKAAEVAEPKPPRAEIVPEIAAMEPETQDTPPAVSSRPNTVTREVSSRPASVAKPPVEKAETPAVAQAKKKPVKDKEKTAEKEKTEKANVVANTARETPARTAGSRAHVVGKGDTVFNIAKRYGFTAEEIAKANKLDGEFRIRMGQQLRIPVRR